MKETERIARTLSLGRTRFVLLYGVLGWGLTTAVLYDALMYYLRHRDSWQEIGLSLVIFPLGGVFWGLAMWALMRRKLAKEAGKPDGGS